MMMTMKMWIFMLILPTLMVKYSIAIGHSKSDEIVARIDLIKVPNFNLFLPRLSLINCNAWWLDYKLFDSSNIEIIIPIALQRSLNLQFIILDRPFYLHELKYHYQIYLSCKWLLIIFLFQTWFNILFHYSITEESKTVSGTDGSLCIDENGSFVSSKP